MRIGIGIWLTGGGGVGFYPDASLALDFTAGRYRVGTGASSSPDFASLPGLTVTRTSVGYAETSDGSLVQFASNVARITDKGLLVEEARTNTQTNTNVNPSATTNVTLVDTGSGGSLAVVDDAVELARVGLTGNAFRIIGGTAKAYANIAGGAATDVPHVLSAYIRGGAGEIIYSSGAALTHTFTSLATYRRVTAPATAPGAVARTMMVGANAGQTVYFVLNSMEAGAFATSPIPVSGASATRAADVVSFTYAPGNVFTMVAEYTADGTNTGGIVATNPVSVGSYVSLNATTSAATWFAGTITLAAQTAGNNKLAAMVNTTGTVMRASRNGAAVVGSTASDYAGAGTSLVLGRVGGGTLTLNNYLRRAVIYPRAFSDAELQAATL